MNIRERILLSLSRSPEAADYESENLTPTTDDSLALLHRVYPSLAAIVSGKRVADFGCGSGKQSIALVAKYHCSVVGIDTNRRTLDMAVATAKAAQLSTDQVSFVDKISEGMMNKFDVIISQNSFEHFGDPSEILDEMRKLLKPSGVILLTFGPPWFAPYGSHMQFFCKVPWLNVLFPENVVMKVRTSFRSDGARRYEEVESGLNRMTVAKFEQIVASSKLQITHRKYDCVKGINFLARIPLLREFFINHITAILSSPDGAGAKQRT